MWGTVPCLGLTVLHTVTHAIYTSDSKTGQIFRVFPLCRPENRGLEEPRSVVLGVFLIFINLRIVQKKALLLFSFFKELFLFLGSRSFHALLLID